MSLCDRIWANKSNLQNKNTQSPPLPLIEASLDFVPTLKENEIKCRHSIILEHALQWPIMMLKFKTIPKFCVIKLGFVSISYTRRFLHTYIVKTLVLLTPHEVRIYDVDFGSKMLKTSILGQKCWIHWL